MKAWKNPEMKNLGIERTEDNCSTKDKHDHCPSCGESSSSCDCIAWTPIDPSIPTPPGQS